MENAGRAACQQANAVMEGDGVLGPTDQAFLWMRILILVGGLGWLYFAPFGQEEKVRASLVFVFFAFYTAALYVAIFFTPERIRFFYLLGLLFDLLFLFCYNVKIYI